MLFIDDTDINRTPLFALDPCEGEYHEGGCPEEAVACSNGDYEEEDGPDNVKPNRVLATAQVLLGSRILEQKVSTSPTFRQRPCPRFLLLTNDRLFASFGEEPAPVWIVTRSDGPDGWLSTSFEAAKEYYDEL